MLTVTAATFEDIKKVAKYFEILLEIGSKNKDKVTNNNLSDNRYNCYNNDTISSKKTARDLFKKVRQEKGLIQAQLAKVKPSAETLKMP